MRLSRGLLLVSAGSGLLSVLAALLAMPGAPLQYGVITLLALLGYVAVAGRDAGRVRWALVAGIGLLAIVAALRLFWQHEQADDPGWLTYGQFDEAAMLARWREAIDRQRLAALGLLLGVLCLAAGVFALPSRGGPRRGLVTTVLALLVLAGFGLRVSWPDRAPLSDLLGAAWPALLGTLVAMGALALSGQRADRRWLLPAGSLLLAVATATLYLDLARAWSSWWLVANPREDAFLEVGVMVSTSAASFPQVSWAVETAIALAAPVLMAVGALHSARDAGDQVER